MELTEVEGKVPELSLQSLRSISFEEYSVFEMLD